MDDIYIAIDHGFDSRHGQALFQLSWCGSAQTVISTKKIKHLSPQILACALVHYTHSEWTGAQTTQIHVLTLFTSTNVIHMSTNIPAEIATCMYVYLVRKSLQFLPCRIKEGGIGMYNCNMFFDQTAIYLSDIDISGAVH